MPDANLNREIKTKPLSSEGRQTRPTVYLVAHLAWEREWYDAFDRQRAALLNLVASLHRELTSRPENTDALRLRVLLLGGQTVILDDIAAIRPDLMALLVIFNAGNRLGIGPWYVDVDKTLVDGESLIRNLLIARSDAEQHGLRLMPIVYADDVISWLPQLPQILQGFGIEAVLGPTSARLTPDVFRWEGSDGSCVLFIPYEVHGLTTEARFKVALGALQAQRPTRPEGPYLWMYDARDIHRIGQVPSLVERLDMTVQQSDLREFLHMLQRQAPDKARPVMRGELSGVRMSSGGSARIDLKQRDAYLRYHLTHHVEPWVAIALTHGRLAFPENVRALLHHTWRVLLQNQLTSVLRGAVSDAVHEESLLRSRRVEDQAAHLLGDALGALSGRLAYGLEVDVPRTHVVVWNPHNWPVDEVVEVFLHLPEGMHPHRLRMRGQEDDLLFGWEPFDSGGGRLIFLASAPAVGYASYTLLLSHTPPDMDKVGVRTFPGRVIARVSGETLSVQSGQLIWKNGEHVIEDLLSFVDSGDGGDLYTYSPPVEDVSIRADTVDNVMIESTPLYERLIIHHRMRVAPELTPDGVRERGVKLIELRTTATFYDHMPGVYFSTTVNNTARDHRLRVHLRTGIGARSVLVGGHYGVFERSIETSQPDEQAEHRTAASTSQRVVCVQKAKRGGQSLALVTRGLPEYEPLLEDDQVTLALTLLRSVGWLRRPSADAVPDPAAIPTPMAQCIGNFTTEYALIDTAPGNAAQLLRTAYGYTAPLQAYQYVTPPDRPYRSFLSIVSDRAIGADSDGEGVILTAFKAPEKGSGWLVRLYNPHPAPVEVYVTPFRRPERAYLVTLAEEFETVLELDANGRVGLVINPQELATLLFTFDQEGGN
ncbi:MAG: glycosyl hydrolase-related protein [Chloroflexota bacterium]